MLQAKQASALAYGFYHLSCLMLLMHKPGPKFAYRSVGWELSATDVRNASAVRNVTR